MTLREITRGLLFENGVSREDILHSIDKHTNVVIRYEGTDGTHNGERMIQPVAYGLTKSGFPVIRAYETFGDTKTKIPEWKFFRVDRISYWRDTNKIFLKPAKLFNPNDDKTMGMVIKIAKFNNHLDEPDNGYKKSKYTGKEVYRTDTESKLADLKKRIENAVTIDDLKANKPFDSVKDNRLSSGYKSKDDENVDAQNYNVYDDSLAVQGKNIKRNSNHYWQKRKGGKFVKGKVTDVDNTYGDDEIEKWLNRDNGNVDLVNELRDFIKGRKSPITINEMRKYLKNI